MVMARFITTAEVCVSKIFPAGAGWQAGSLLAGGVGYAGDSAQFALMTGLGDGAAVVVGHTSYYAVKKALWDPKISVGSELGSAVWLGSAAVCSGSLWQPIVNAMQAGENVPFEAVAATAWVGCGSAFFLGLRAGRTVMPWMPHADNSNFAGDASLSMAIGGATAFFVGTDVAYLGGQGNFLRPLVGVESFDSDLTGIIKAGTSTALGFTAAQAAQNVTYPAKQAWLD